MKQDISDQQPDFQSDVEAIQRIDAIPRILQVVCRTTGMGFSAVARVTEDRWICCASLDEINFGLGPGGELAIGTTICNEIRECREPVVIDHVAQNDIYRKHHTPALYGFQSYISVPIILPNGTMFGTLCAIDPKPARVETPETIGMFKLFAELIAFHLDANRELASAKATLLTAQRDSELREQFIAVLGHDLRNPLASIDAGVRIIARAKPEDMPKLLALMGDTVKRMSGLIDNVLDFARGRLGGGFSLSRKHEQLEPILRQVVSELQTSSPIEIETRFDLTTPVYCDRVRLSQLFSNLLGNAIAHGTAFIKVQASSKSGGFELSVSNGGRQIPPQILPRLFQPFYRGEGREHQGLGLGLYIASEIARAHGGRLDVASTPDETRFTFSMPNRGE